MTVGIHQPNFMPWSGFFNKISRSDVFVVIDDVQFVNKSICNRVKIKNAAGQEVWLAVPVTPDKGLSSTFNETRIRTADWYQKGLDLLRNSYLKAPYFQPYFTDIERLLSQPYDSLTQMNLALIEYFCKVFDINTPIYVQSHLDTTFGKKNDLTLGITKYFKGDIYLSGMGAKKYNDEALFTENGVSIVYQNFQPREYRQINGTFVPGLSVVDLLFNEGPSGVDFIK